MAEEDKKEFKYVLKKPISEKSFSTPSDFTDPEALFVRISEKAAHCRPSRFFRFTRPQFVSSKTTSAPRSSWRKASVPFLAFFRKSKAEAWSSKDVCISHIRLSDTSG